MTIKAILQSYESQIVVVFAILIGAIIAIKMISIFIVMAKRKEEPVVSEQSVETGGVVAILNNYKVSDDTFTITGIDDKTAGCVIAIVAQESGIPVDELQFKSIKAIS